MNRYKHEWSLRTRVFSMVIALFVIVISIIFTAFNFFMNNYIDTNAAAQLEVYTKHSTVEGSIYWPDMTKQPINRFGVQTKAFVISQGYDIIHIYDETETYDCEIISSYLTLENIRLDEISNMHIRSEGKVYYLSTMPDEKHDAAYLVFFADITAISEFAKTINTALIIIVVLAAVLSFGVAVIISRSVTKPIEHISDFAVGIGKGHFNVITRRFRDKELAMLAEAMNKSAGQLAQYDNKQQTFFQNVSHELRTPLMAIKLKAESIHYGILDNKESSGVIISEVDRLSELVEDLLYISRIDNISREIPMQEDDIRETLASCVENQRSIADKKKIVLEFDFSDEPVLLHCNKKHVYRALYNLLANAIRYAKSKVILTCKTQNGKVIVSISDDGSGIPPSDMPHIFERFYKSENGKHGIGLSIVKSVAELHGGEITVVCTDMTRFILKLPIK